MSGIYFWEIYYFETYYFLIYDFKVFPLPFTFDFFVDETDKIFSIAILPF